MAYTCGTKHDIDNRESVLATSTLCLKKVPTFKLSVTLSNLNQFSKFSHYQKAYEICYKTRFWLTSVQRALRVGGEK